MLSPSCSSALVYGPDAGSALLLTGLPSSAQTQTVEVASSTSIKAAAVSDSGSILFATLQPDRTVLVQAIASGSHTATSVSLLSGYGGMAFLPGSETAVLADSVQNTVSLVKGLARTAAASSFTQIATASDGVSRPVAVAAADGGRSLVVVNGGLPNSPSASVLRIQVAGDLSRSTASASTLCQCSPIELVALSGNAVFQLSEPSSGTVYAYDGDSTSPRIVFLPSDIRASGLAPSNKSARSIATAADGKVAAR